jgi:hypothetical protein
MAAGKYSGLSPHDKCLVDQSVESMKTSVLEEIRSPSNRVGVELEPIDPQTEKAWKEDMAARDITAALGRQERAEAAAGHPTPCLKTQDGKPQSDTKPNARMRLMHRQSGLSIS